MWHLGYMSELQANSCGAFWWRLYMLGLDALQFFVKVMVVLFLLLRSVSICSN